MQSDAQVDHILINAGDVEAQGESEYADPDEGLVSLSHLEDISESSLGQDQVQIPSRCNDEYPSRANHLTADSSGSTIFSDSHISLNGCQMQQPYGAVGIPDSIFGQGMLNSVGLGLGLGNGELDWLDFQPQEMMLDSATTRNDQGIEAGTTRSRAGLPGSAPVRALDRNMPTNSGFANGFDMPRRNVQPWPFDQARDQIREQLPSRYELPPLHQVIRSSSRTSHEGTQSALEILIELLSTSGIPENWSQDYSLLPGLHLLQHCLDQYVAGFHDILPVIHVPTFKSSKTPPVLLASMSCIGAMLLKDKDTEEASKALCDLSSRMILWLGGQDSNNFSDLSYLTASCLYQIYSLGSGNRQLYQDADRSRGILIGSLRGMGLLKQRVSIDHNIPRLQPVQEDDPADSMTQWLHWRDQEQEKRVTWASFEYDCSLCTLTGRRGAVDLAELPKSLPCIEELWKAPSVQGWRSLASHLSPPFFGASVADVLDAIMTGRPFPAGLSSWGKRLCSQIIGRLLWDLKQLGVLTLIQALRPSSLGSVQDEGKALLLQGLGNLSCQMKKAGSVQELIDYNVDDVMELVLYIVRHLPTTPQSPHYEVVNAAKRKLKTEFARDPRCTRKLIWHAAQITAVANGYLVSAPCEILRVFMGAILLMAVTKYSPGSMGSGKRAVSPESQPSIRLDQIDTDDEAAKVAEAWIQHGGPANVLGVDNISSKELGITIYTRTQTLLEEVQFWGLSRKFIKILQLFQESEA
ncbi:hypothetical protein N7474_007414 [Penicillium riverlandense]|uniref:uncharacterized protein n=1 Tax=Penicillium riverlandense TaxID=1903569 RepID=UPI002546D628|nr:uncharacterized protein N7474_007414 [Penicillium riverlandense]KAJ5815637.1 hypothetical protein N7474_007414 [Penicillium riverlandense]